MNLLERATGKNPYFYPKSFLFPEQKEEFLKQYIEGKPWIIKPPGGSCGRGIKIINKINDEILQEKILIQEYIERPMLIHGYKFDLRFYVAVPSLDPLRVYNYEDGLVRLATHLYKGEVTSDNDLAEHLTNFSVNRKQGEYLTTNDVSMDGKGSKWSHHPLWPYMKSIGVDGDLLKRRIDDAITTVFIAARPQLIRQRNHRQSVELYGVDIMLDNDLNIYILEVNVSPALGTSSKLDFAIKAPLVRDFLNICLIPKQDELAENLEIELESTDDNLLKEFVAIAELEKAEKRLGDFRRIFPRPEFCARKCDLLRLDHVLDAWLSMDNATQQKFIKKRQAAFDKFMNQTKNAAIPCKIS